MKFNDMPYTRPEAKAFIGQYAALTQQAQAAADGAALLELFEQHNKLDTDFSGAHCLAQIRHTLDTRDVFYDQENDYFDEAGPGLGNAQLDFYRALLKSPYKEALSERYGQILLQKLEVAVGSASEEVVELMQQENALASRYQKLYASGQVEFDGKSLTLPELGPYKESRDQAVRKAAFEAEGRFFDEHQQEFDDLYTQLIENRNAQARKMGYENYVPLSYLRMGRLGYGQAQVESFRKQVAESVTPLANRLMQQQFERVGIPKAKLYDCPVRFADGNPAPVGGPAELLEAAKALYEELSPETAEFIDFMLESDLFDLASRPGKAPGGYCELIADQGAPFIFSNFNGTCDDVDVLTHEAGHAFQAYVAAKQGLCLELANPGMESCEIHSMAMEFLTEPWHKLFFGGNETEAAKYGIAHALAALIFLPYGCMVDEFQHEAYAKPELSAQERNQLWLSLEAKYRPWVDLSGLPFYGRGAGWQRQLHIYLYPFYYIDYCLAQMVALQFFAANLNDPKDAWQRYLALVKQAGTKTYAGLVEAAKLAVPFNEGAIEPVACQVTEWVEQQTNKL